MTQQITGVQDIEKAFPYSSLSVQQPAGHTAGKETGVQVSTRQANILHGFLSCIVELKAPPRQSFGLHSQATSRHVPC